MRLEQATIALVPRTTANCLDLAVRYVGRNLREVGTLWLIVAVPSVGLIALLDRWVEMNIFISLAVVFLASSPLGVLLGLTAMPGAFGEPVALRALPGRLWRGGLGLMLKDLGLRVVIATGLVLCVIPGVVLALRTAFTVERSCLAAIDRRLHNRRADRVMTDEMGDLLLRAGGIALFCVCLWLWVFLTADTLAHLLFGFPILLNRLAAAGGLFGAGDYAATLLFEDVRVQAALVATALAIYPIGRLAWFFCYIDLRVRRDLWDIELRFTEEARRLEVTR